MKGIQRHEINTTATTARRPTIKSSVLEGLLRILVQMSMVKMVEDELKIEVSDDITAAIMTDSINPERPYQK